jgi:predicted enzyme related to lactoylglutathione lyase
MAHAVVHFEIGGPDDELLAEFYAGLLGWGMRPIPGIGYTLVDTYGGEGINGGVERRRDGSSEVTFYIQADDLQAVLDKVNLLGGKTDTPITELPGMATFAKFEDLDGLIIGLVLGPEDPGQATAGQPATGGQPETGEAAVAGPSAGTGAPVDWFEVQGADPDRSQRFYAEIFGWQAADAGPADAAQAGSGQNGSGQNTRSQNGSGPAYRMIDTRSARGIRGGIGAARQGPWATVYARVPDVAAALARAVELGGTREYGPDAVDDHMQTGAVRDPAGNVFGVYSHVPH